MIGVEFGAPTSLKLRASWSMIEAANKGLFCQLITIPLFKEHKILTQVAGHGSHTIKMLPSYLINDEDCTWIETAFDKVIAESHRVPGAIWSLGKTLIENAMAKPILAVVFGALVLLATSVGSSRPEAFRWELVPP